MMQLLAAAPPEFQAIQRAFAQALRVKGGTPHPLHVGLVCNDKLVAAGDLHSYQQAACLSEYMREFGWTERLLGTEDEMRDCDVVYWLEHAQRHDDPSFIRRPVTELWA